VFSLVASKDTACPGNLIACDKFHYENESRR
jgi:hypothetical protein